jgi:tRNA pseudouridine55 synthase
MDKAYLATIRLGVETDTHDPEGEVTGRSQGWEELGETEVRQAMDRFRGENLQRPPVYSAKKIRGEPAHRRVRRGEGVELTPVPVQVHELELLETNLPDIRLHVRCSSGTYVRALARDLGVALGVGGHLAALRRTGIGPFDLDSALPLESFAQLPDVKKGLIPAADALSHLPSVQVGALEATRIRQGQSLPTPGQGLPEGTPICVTMGGELLAIAAREGGQLRPRKVLVLD